MKKKILPKDVLEELYVNQSKSIFDIATKILNCGTKTVRQSLEYHNIPIKEIGSWCKNDEINLSNEEIEIINGCLLGDGHIDENGKSSCFSYASSQKEHVDYVFSLLKKYATPRYKNGPVKYHNFDKRTNKTYTGYLFKTQSNITFYRFRKKWYPNGVKIVPKDLILTKLTILLWYIGDGSLYNGRRSQLIKFATDAFSEDDLNYLVDKLINFEVWKWRNTLFLPRRKIKDFLNYIGYCPVNCYNYKWNYIEYINQTSGKKQRNHSSIYNTIINEYKTDEKSTVLSLSKKYDVPRACIKRIFIKNNIFIRQVYKSILQLDLNGNFVKEWKSGRQIVKELKYNPNIISRCCLGKRKTSYKKSYWKFKNEK